MSLTWIEPLMDCRTAVFQSPKTKTGLAEAEREPEISAVRSPAIDPSESWA